MTDVFYYVAYFIFSFYLFLFIYISRCKDTCFSRCGQILFYLVCFLLLSFFHNNIILYSFLR